ncbi:hypothetical protein ES703_32072 [subsurface metagenome]|jgi:hypothetical protein
MMTEKMQTRATQKRNYNTFIGQLELVGVRLVSARIENLGYKEYPVNYRIYVRSESSYTNAEREFEVVHNYKLRMKDVETKRTVAKLSVAFSLTYSSEVPMTDDIFDIFKVRNLPLNTWPYFREFVHNSFARVGWVGVVAPVYKVGVSPPKD